MKRALSFCIALALSGPLLAAQSEQGTRPPKKVDCDRQSLQNEIDKLIKSRTNSLAVSGDCYEYIVIAGHVDLTLIGSGSITGPGADFEDNPTVLVKEGSKVRLEGLTLVDGSSGLSCTERSHCTLVDVTVRGGTNGVEAQDQSGLDILGASEILDSREAGGWGIGVFGASAVNVRPASFSDFEGGEQGTLVSGHGVGVTVLDGSFFRSDNADIVNNQFGVVAQRNATIKVISNTDASSGERIGQVSGNAAVGVVVTRGSTGQVVTTIADNGGTGVLIGPLSFALVFSEFSNNGAGNVVCDHPTAVSQDDQGPGGSTTCP